MNDGAAFPARDLAIFLAAGVIIVSLVAASFGLPFLLNGLELPPEPSQQEGEDLARIAAAEAAIRAIEQAQHHMGEGRGDADLYTDAGYVSWSFIASGSMVAQRPAKKHF